MPPREHKSTTHDEDMQRIANAWHLVHSIHRNLRYMRTGGPMLRSSSIPAIKEDAEQLWRIHVIHKPTELMQIRCKGESKHLACCIHELDPPPDRHERAALIDAFRHLAGVGGKR